MNNQDLKNKVFGQWRVIDIDHNTKTRKHWVCRCQCGYISSIRQDYLLKNKSTKCKNCHNKQQKNNLIGQQFGYWNVIAEHLSNRGVYWKCLCKCGDEHIIKGSELIRGKTNKCKKCSGLTRVIPNVAGEITHRFWDSTIRNAKVRNLDFLITPEEAWNKFLYQNRKCALSNIDITFTQKNRDFKNQTASLDRINSSKGYTIDNTQWLHKTINRIKMGLSESEFLFYIKNIYQNYIDKNLSKSYPYTIFCDIDGVLLEQNNKSLSEYISFINNNKVNTLNNVREKLSLWNKNNHKIILTTARPSSLRKSTEEQLLALGLFYNQLIMDLSTGNRYIINDNKEDSTLTCRAFNVPRNEGLINVNI